MENANLEHGVVGLEAIGTLLPQEPTLAVLQTGDVAANTVTALCNDERADHASMLGAQCQCLHTGGWTVSTITVSPYRAEA